MVLMGKSECVAVSDDTIAALQIRHRAKNVRDELLKAHLWLLRNPRRRPSRMWVFVDNWLNKAPAVIRPVPVVIAWWSTDERTINQGEALGLTARPGESMSQYRDRIAKAMQAAA